MRRRGANKVKDHNFDKTAHVQSPIVPVHVTETKKTFDEADTIICMASEFKKFFSEFFLSF